MTIAGVATAYPPYKYDQQTLLPALQRHWVSRIDDPAFMQRLQARVGVETRYLALPLDQYYSLNTFGQANDHWIRVGTELGQQALCHALSRAGLSTSDLGAVFFTSITGISSPSIDARLINRMNLPRTIKRVPIFGLGCVAGAACISRAADYVLAYPDQVAAVLSVELCSLTPQQDDTSIANMISSSLFGDGAAAVMLAGAACEAWGPKVLTTRSAFYPDTEHVMGWDISEKGFRIVLSRDVPEVIFQNLASDVDEFLAENNLSRSDVGAWVLHTGGPRILEATARALDLPDHALDVSWECLRRRGNLSSASVLAVLEEFMQKRRPDAGTYGLLAAMGPGFCAELILLQW
jgi:alkylresorcinol/alkylpyrone synthase